MIRQTFKATEIEKYRFCYYCQIASNENPNYSAYLYAPTREHLESMRDNILFGLNERAELMAENERLRNR